MPPESALPPVLFVSDHLGHDGGRIHGATRYFLDVLPRLSEQGVLGSVCFLRGPHAARSTLEAAGVEPEFLGRHKLDPRTGLDVAERIRSGGAGLVHAAGMKGILSGVWAAKRCGVPCVVQLHDMLPQGGLIRLGMRRACRAAARVLVISEAVGAFAVEHFGADPARVTVLRPGVDLARFRVRTAEEGAARKAEFGFEAGDRVVVNVGRMDANKNQGLTVEAFARLRERVPAARLLLVGGGEMEGALREQVRGLGLEGAVRFGGALADTAAVLSFAELMLTTPVSEGLGLAAMEALAMGVPVVGLRVGGLAEAVRSGVDGLLVEAGGAEALAEAAAGLLASEEMRRAFAAAGRERAAREFGVDAHVEGLLKVYAAVREEGA